MLLGLLLTLPATVVCTTDECHECELGLPETPASYEASFGCDGGDLTVTAGDESDVADIGACGGGQEATASNVIGGVDARVDFFVQQGGNAVTVTCAYDIGADLAAPITCAGTTQRPIDFFYSSGTGAVSWSIRGYETALADGADTGISDPHVFITCPGPGVVEEELVLGGEAYETPDLPLFFDSDCNIRIEMLSSASAAGQTFHSVTLTAHGTSSCSKNADCPSGLRCGSDGFCQDGSEGNACTSSHLPTGGGDCSEAAPFCVTATGLSTTRCTDGSNGDVCAGDFQCGTWCFEYFPGIGICQDGSLGNLCRGDDDCQSGCDCVHFGGSTGNCLGLCGDFGVLGSSCTYPVECDAPYGCVEAEGQLYCLPCTVDAQCAITETCQAGECVP
jgi:hypothetical protein